MKITIEPTSKTVDLNNGVPARIWEGTDESGAPVMCFVTRISPLTHCPEVNERFARELQETRKPSPVAEALPLRLIL
jgi:hypothetical protein